MQVSDEGTTPRENKLMAIIASAGGVQFVISGIGKDHPSNSEYVIASTYHPDLSAMACAHA